MVKMGDFVLYQEPLQIGEIEMEQKLSWEQIAQQYKGQWVELVDYEWQDGEPYPTAGAVRVHDADRKQFYRQANQNRPLDSAILFVGDLNLPLGVVHNNLARISECK